MIEVEIAAGKPEKENFAIVAPEINGKTVSMGVRLKPIASKGSVETVNGLCDGDVQIGIVQLDVLVQRTAKSDCAGKIVTLGSPLYPYEGFMVVRDDTGEDSLSRMVENLKSSSVLHIAAGGAGSGGEATLRAILATKPDWKQVIDIQPDGNETALNKLRDHELDAFFVMDGPKSPLLNEVRDAIDSKTKQRIFKFVDVRPNQKLLDKEFNGRPVYGTITLQSWVFSAVKTISTPAVVAIRDDYYRANPEIAAKIRQATEDALPSIVAKAGAQPDWRENFQSR
jgi:TRAP-type uncharacterized transport system substrate-binding protein